MRFSPPAADGKVCLGHKQVSILGPVFLFAFACSVDVAGLKSPTVVSRDAAITDSQNAERTTVAQPDARPSLPDAAAVATKPEGGSAGDKRAETSKDSNKLPETGPLPFPQDTGQGPDSQEDAVETGGAEVGTEGGDTGMREVDSAVDAPNAEPIKLTGEAFGTSPPYNNNPRFGFDKAFDGDTDTFVDDAAESGGYAGIDLGENKTARVVRIRYFPRKGGYELEARMRGGKFQCSATSKTEGYTDLYTIPAVPPIAWTEVSIADSPSCRYLRYLGPTKGNTNVAEIEFWGFSQE